MRRKGTRSFFAGGKPICISDSPFWLVPSRCLCTSTICSEASLLSDMWLLGGDDAASLLPSCGPTSLHACVILGVCTLFCERTFPHSHTHTHTLFWSNSSASQLSTRTTTKHHQHGGRCRCVARRKAKSLQVIVRHTREVCHMVEDGSYRVSTAQS